MDLYDTFLCAYCGEENAIFIEPEDGLRQTVTVDCEICCRPNLLRILIQEDRTVIEAEPES